MHQNDEEWILFIWKNTRKTAGHSELTVIGRSSLSLKQDARFRVNAGLYDRSKLWLVPLLPLHVPLTPTVLKLRPRYAFSGYS